MKNFLQNATQKSRQIIRDETNFTCSPLKTFESTSWQVLPSHRNSVIGEFHEQVRRRQRRHRLFELRHFRIHSRLVRMTHLLIHREHEDSRRACRTLTPKSKGCDNEYFSAWWNIFALYSLLLHFNTRHVFAILRSKQAANFPYTYFGSAYAPYRTHVTSASTRYVTLAHIHEKAFFRIRSSTEH